MQSAIQHPVALQSQAVQDLETRGTSEGQGIVQMDLLTSFQEKIEQQNKFP